MTQTTAKSRQVKVRVELGRRLLAVVDAAELGPGGLVELDDLAEGSMDVYADGRLCARGRAVVVDGKLAVRIEEVLPAPAKVRRV